MNVHEGAERPTDELAADYVLGLLEGAELAMAERRVTTDTDFCAAVNAWRERLADLDATGDALKPNDGLWDRIAGSTKVKPTIPLPGARTALDGATLWHSLRFWRFAGIGGMAAAFVLGLVLIGALGTSRQLRNEVIALTQSKPVYVAVLVNDATREAGAIVNAFANGRVELIPLRDIDVPPGRSLQVWTLWDRGVGPKSVGLSGRSRSLELDLKSLPETISDQLFEITLEPDGGSPTGRPTGPILFKGNAARAL